MSIEEIREAKDELHRLSADEEQRILYEVRAKQLRDEISALNKARRDGIEQGKLEVAKALLDISDDETIALKLDISLEKVSVLRRL